MNKNIISLLLLTFLFVVGCAKPETVSPNENAKRYLDAWLYANHNGLEPIGRGIYVLDEKSGNGAAYNKESFVYVDYTIRSLDGTLVNSSNERINQQEGSYNAANYYGPSVLVADEIAITVGVQDLLTGMKVGGTKTAVIPSWLMTYERYKKDSEYIKHSTSSPTVVYELTLRDAFNDVIKWEADSLARFVNKTYPGLDTLSAGFYLKKLKETSSEKELPIDTTLKITYVGRLLNGKVFDTNNADSAKFYNIYNKAREYGPAEIKMAENVEDMSIKYSGSSESSTEFIIGFKKTIKGLKPGEKGIGLFVSGLGYRENGSGDKIPPYSPLIFQIDIE